MQHAVRHRFAAFHWQGTYVGTSAVGDGIWRDSSWLMVENDAADTCDIIHLASAEY